MKNRITAMTDKAIYLKAASLSDSFLIGVYPIIRSSIKKMNLFDYDDYDIVMDSIIKYYEDERKAPKKNIRTIVGLIDGLKEKDLMRSLVSEFDFDEKIDAGYVEKSFVDNMRKRICLNFFQRGLTIAAKSSWQTIEKFIADELARQNKVFANRSLLTDSVDPFRPETIFKHFSKKKGNSWFRLPYPLSIISREITPSSFSSIIGVEKAGKSWALEMIKRQCLLAQRPCVHITIEMTEIDCLDRTYSLISGKSLTGDPCNVSFMDCLLNQNGVCKYSISPCSLHENNSIDITNYEDYKPCTKCKGGRFINGFLPAYVKKFTQPKKMELEDALLAAKKWKQILNGKLWIIEKPTLDLKELKDIVFFYKETKKISPLFIIDYVDIMSTSKDKTPEVISNLWQGVKTIANEFNVPIFTVEQAKAAERPFHRLTRSSFSGSKGKDAAVNQKLAIAPRTSQEEQDDIYRMSCLYIRERTVPDFEVMCIASKAYGQPFIDAAIVPNDNYVAAKMAEISNLELSDSDLQYLNSQVYKNLN